MASYNLVQVAPSGVVDYIVSLNNRFTKVDSNTINVNDVFTINVTMDLNWLYVSITIGGITTSQSQLYIRGREIKVRSVIDENFVYIVLIDLDPPYDELRHVLISMITDGNNNYFAGQNYWQDHSMSSYADKLTGIDFYKTDGTHGYVFSKMINFAAPAGNIAYSSIAPLSNGGSLALYVAGILSCSTVAPFSSIALPNGKNYIAIDSNAMIQIDT